ncbi:hypothetical protein [Nesterenkonia haasae]|uniref:hypothetical protein n=1 Tax=Nesterenkonia haasae TaxID=2587813 RepID=UPI001391809F|nr:hypothetical protein [Nesterenkonia haasae]
MTRDDAPRRSRLEDAAASVAIPEDLHAAWTGVAPELSVGQVWRARWHDRVQLVVILSTDQRTTVLPLSFDLDYADTNSASIAAEAGPFGLPTLAWRTLKRGVPNAVLDRFAGWLESEVTAALLAAEPGQGGDDRATPHPVRVYQALIEDTMDELSAVRWHGDGSGELSTMLQNSDLRIQDVADTLGTTPQKALAIWRGQIPLTNEEARKLAPGLGEPVETILAANPTPPSKLIDCLENPRRHHQVLAYAAQRGGDVATAYRDLSHQTWALAARQTGQKATNWDRRLDTLFAAVLDEH